MPIFTQIDTVKSGALSRGAKGFRTGKSVMTFDNEEALARLLVGIPESLHHYIVVDSLGRALVPMRRKIKANAPKSSVVHGHRNKSYKPGNLRRAIKIRKSKNPRKLWASVEVMQGRGMPDGWYARFFEWGTVGRQRKEGQRQQKEAVKYHRFFSRGVDSTRKLVQQKATMELQDVVEKQVKRQLDKYKQRQFKATIKIVM